MKIGIDIDGVLTDIEQFQLDYGSEFYYKNYKKEVVNYKAYETIEMFKGSREQDDLFWEKYFEFYSTNTRPREFASEVIRKLKDEGNEIYIITARGSFLSHSNNVMTLEKNKSIVLYWLKQHDIYYDKIIFTPEEKMEICMDNNIDIMIEDKVENIKKISTQIPVICYHVGYNETCNGENIYRAYSWYNVYSIIEKLKSESRK